MKTLLDSFQLRVTHQDEKWFAGAWRTFNGESSRFHEAFDPEQTLETGAHVWGGLMLPDTIPILGDGTGDHLCARFATNGTLSEVVAWNHEGGSWRHYGRSVEDALNFDRIESALDGDETDEDIQPHAELSPIALSESECSRALTSRLLTECLRKGGGKIAASVGVSWKEFATWLPDPSLIPSEKLEQIAATLRMNPSDLIFQDWNAAVQQALLVLNHRNDLAWPYAVLGWFYERQGHPNEAIDFYKTGAMTLGSSSAFTETWTRTPEYSCHKFAAQRLQVLSNSVMEEEVRRYIAAKTISEIREFWLARAKAATEKHDHASAYRYLYFAGWDSPFTDEMKNILESMKSSAKKAGFPALAALASLHSQTM